MDGIQLRFTNSRSVVSLILIGLLSVTIGGCGSGDDSPPASPPASTPVATTAEGLWTGSTDTNRTILGAVLDDGTYYFLSSNSKCNTTSPDGLRCCHDTTMLHALE
jgi:hypothetical protein